MTVDVIPKRIQRVWDKSNIRGSVLASLCLQILLIFLAPSRKRTRRYFITIILWSAYLLADFVAAYAIGLISNNQGDECDKSNVNHTLSAFWAPFLLLHLGGPDSITAFSLEDNELWIRHLFVLIAELIMVAYVFTQAIPFPFWLPTVLVLLAGVIKYAEQIRALYLASLDRFSEDSMEEGLEIYNQQFNEGEEIEIVRYGFQLYKVFRKLIVDRLLSIAEIWRSETFLFELQALDAFKLMEVELNFMYDALFTKLATMHGSYLWYIFRFICTAFLAASFILFKSHHKPHDIHPLDIAITYSLLIGAIILEILSLIKLVFSDWTVALLNPRKAVIPISKIHKFISFPCRWSNSMAQYDLISFASRRQPFKLRDKVIEVFGLEKIFEELMYTKFIRVETDLKIFIFDKLKEKVREAHQLKNLMNDIYSSRGVWAVKKYTDSSDILRTVKAVKFEESVLIWHIATDLLYYNDNPDNSSDVDNNNNHQNICMILWDYILHLRKKKSLSTDPEEAHNSSDVDHKKLCKILSDYMFYLFFLHPSLISVIPATSRIKFQDTCEHVKEIVGSQEMNKTKACMKLLSGIKNTFVINNSVLHDATFLSMKIEDKCNDEVKKWEMMSEVWVELLCYGATHSRGHVHAQQLSKGGELVTFVWLLMAHFGWGDEIDRRNSFAALPPGLV